MTLNCIFCQTEESRASVFLPIFEGSVSGVSMVNLLF